MVVTVMRPDGVGGGLMVYGANYVAMAQIADGCTVLLSRGCPPHGVDGSPQGRTHA